MPDLSTKTAALTEEVHGLRASLDEAVKAFEERVNSVEKDRRRFMTVLLVIVGVLLLVAITVVQNTVTASNLQATNERLENVIARQEAVTQRALCPVFQVFLGGYNPNTRPPEARAEYDRAFAEMRDAYGNLGCVGEFVAPRIGG